VFRLGLVRFAAGNSGQERPVAKRDLTEYRRKRDPARTSEPMSTTGRPRARRGKPRPVFVVQRHDARRLHYDFRLERDGALASWAVPKGVPLEAGQRALAVHVEDHPLDYATFEGEIPKGEYGAGTVEIWDSGTYELVEEKKDGGLTVRLEGTRLQGLWTLIPAKLDGNPKNWLLIRKRDDAQKAEGDGRARRRYEVMMATLDEKVPKGDSWLFEVKWDGYRALAYLSGGEVRLVSRNGNDLTDRFRGIADAIPRTLKTPDCVLDGEVCALDENGRPSFSAMQQGKAGTPIVYEAFDLLEVDGEPLVDLPLRERRARLEQLLDRRYTTVRLSEAFEDGDALYEAARQQHLEGIVAKRVDSPYRQGRRTREWLKVKTHGRQEFVIAGYTKGQGRRSGRFGSLVLGVWRGDELSYAGNVGTGFTDKVIDDLLVKLRRLEQKESPFPVVPKMPKVRKADVVWVRPELVCEVEFVEWTHDGRLRAPSFQGLREDKTAREVHREEPLPTELRRGSRTLKLSNLEKVFFPEDGITKGDLLAYYRSVAPVLLPHLKDRPFTMKRYPDGIAGGHFFQKDAPKHMPDWIPTREFEVSTRDSPRRRRKIQAPLVNDELALLWMVNMGCIDLNTWYSRVDRPERPDFVLFDLDPSADAGFPEVVAVALLVKEVLDALGLAGFTKTSGSDGMHVLVPVERRYTYDQTREFAEIVAGTLARTHHGLVTTEWSKAKRRGVLIDANQNGEGKTIASAYSVRPHPGAPVSTPLRWDEVREGLDPREFGLETVLARIEQHGDLFEGVLTEKQSLGKALAAVR
jgi:bifunctional non-homologous end joining protein LigD